MMIPLFPAWFYHFIAMGLGLVFGSFTNVMVARLPKGRSLIKPGSQCLRCHAKIRWWDNIPVLSYLLLHGKCRYCREKISLRYPVIELLVAFLFLSTLIRWGWGPLLWFRDWPFVVLLIAITFIDLEHRIIPDLLSWGGLVLGLISSWAVPGLGLLQSTLGALIGFSVFFGFAWLYQKVTHRVGLGGGDIKLLAMLGAFLGPAGVFATILVSSVLGSVLGIIWAIASKRKNVMTVAIPYGPFLVIGGLCYYLLGDFVWFRFMIPT